MGGSRGRRTGIILIVLILVVVIIGAAGLFLLQGGLGGIAGGGEDGDGGGGGQAEAQPTAPPTPTPPPTLTIIVAARDIPRGQRLTTDTVTTIEWPILESAPPPIGVLVVGDDQNAAGLEQVEGRIARVDILNGQPIIDFMLTPGEEPFELADQGSDAALQIPSGMVALSLPTSRLNTVAYALRPGDHVDIFLSYNFADVDEEFQTLLPNEGLLLSNDLELIAAGFNQVQYTLGREERGIFGTTLVVLPNDGPTGGQIPRRTTQLVIDNAIVMRLGEYSLEDTTEPIVITPIPTSTPVPEGEEGAEVPPEGDTEGPPQPTAIPETPIPDVITLAMPRQDAAVLLHSLYERAAMTIALRSALDDELNDIVTDPVTLDYIINFYNVTPPEPLPVVLDPRVDLLDLTNIDTAGQQAEEEGQ